MQQTSTILAAPVPRHWGRLQRLKNAAILVFTQTAFLLLRCVPFGLARLLAIGLGSLAPWVARRERRRAEAQLAQAFPDLDRHARSRLTRKMFVHLALSAVEGAHMRRFLCGPHAIELDAAQRQVLDQALAQGKGVIAVSGHIGNWELLAQIVVTAGYRVATIAKPLYDPRLTRWAHRLRTARGLEVIWRGEPNTLGKIMTALGSQRLLALLIDQDTRVPGAWVPFFGRQAYTPTAAGGLALKTGATLVVCWTHRVGATHKVHFEPFQVRPGEDEVAITARLTARLEDAVRQAPEQWVWLHARWLRRSADALGGAPRQSGSA